MFISQVIFESSPENEAKLKQIMNGKLEGVKNADGLLGAECWASTGSKTTAYCLVTRWADNAQFKEWMAQSHKNQGDVQKPQGNKLDIRKTGYQFVAIEERSL